MGVVVRVPVPWVVGDHWGQSASRNRENKSRLHILVLLAVVGGMAVAAWIFCAIEDFRQGWLKENRRRVTVQTWA